VVSYRGPNKNPSVPVAGTSYRLLVCSWCGGPAPIYLDKRGGPWARCSRCGCRTFGNGEAVHIGELEGRVTEAVEWPVATWNPGAVSYG